MRYFALLLASAFSEFQKEDVVRHPLVARIVSAYEAHAAALEEK